MEKDGGKGKISISISKDTLKNLDDFRSRNHGVSRSKITEEALKEFLKKEEKK